MRKGKKVRPLPKGTKGKTLRASYLKTDNPMAKAWLGGA